MKYQNAIWTLVTRESIHERGEDLRGREAECHCSRQREVYFDHTDTDYYYRTPFLLSTLCLYYFFLIIFETLVLVYFMLYYMYTLYSFATRKRVLELPSIC